MITSLLCTQLQILVCLVDPLAGFAMHMNSIYLKGKGITTRLAGSRCCWYIFLSFFTISTIQDYSERPR